MTDSSIIQDARDVLAKWREQSMADAPQPWNIITDDRWRVDVLDSERRPLRSDGAYAEDGGDMHPSVACLIVGTAGNPESLEADDALLALAIKYGDLPSGSGSRFIELAKRKAAAIIAADERMSA